MALAVRDPEADGGVSVQVTVWVNVRVEAVRDLVGVTVWVSLLGVKVFVQYWVAVKLKVRRWVFVVVGVQLWVLVSVCVGEKRLLVGVLAQLKVGV